MNSTAAYPSPVISQSDRLSLTIFLALAFHAVIILGMTFDLDDPFDTPLNTMEVTLVHSQSDDVPEDADYLAQSNQQGGGNTQEKVRASSPFSNESSLEDDGIAPTVNQEVSALAQVKKPAQELMNVEKARQAINKQDMQQPLPVEQKKLTAAELLRMSQEIAQLSAEIKKQKEVLQLRPRHTYMSGANAREYRFASYLEAWRAKVERIGNINYPAEAVQRKLSGKLLLDVAINADGSLHKVKVLRSSGHSVLDNAAKRIVRMAAPYPPLSKDILQDTEIMHITRVWNFDSGNGLSTYAK